MNFYHAYYKRQIKKSDGEWHDTSYKYQSILVIANDFNDANKKIMECLKRAETGGYRAALNGEIKECIGIKMLRCFDDGFDIDPVV